MLIFLDSDGVLNSHEYLVRAKDEPGVVKADPALVARLNHLTDVSLAQIVLSSSLRCPETIHDLHKLCVTGKIIGSTPRWWPEGNVTIPRGMEIQHYLRSSVGFWHGLSNTSDLHSYVILDDEVGDMLYEHRNNLLLVRKDIGLTDKDVDLALRILQSPLR